VQRNYYRQGQDLSRKPAASPSDFNMRTQELRLRRMKRIPLLLLVLMAMLFVYTQHHPAEWAVWLHAFSEAGMVGALADWFAVTALFRHPLGIPIPHTAIIANRKNEIGKSMSRFVARHFLEPEVVRKKLQSVDLVGFAISWVNSEKGRHSIENLSATVLRWFLASLHETRVRRFLSRLSTRQLTQLNLSAWLGSTLQWLVRGGRHQQILTQILRYSIVVLHDKNEVIRDRVQQESPWWVPGFVDDRIMKKMLEKIETRLFEMTLDTDHPLREKFSEWVESLAYSFKHSAEHVRMGEELKRHLLENDELQDYLYGLWHELSSNIEADIDQPDSGVRRYVGQWLGGLAEELADDEDMQIWVNQWLVDTITLIVAHNSEQIASLISDTVQSWDGADTSHRVEMAIGRDLQFIRINGTLVGGLVGILIHAIKPFI